MRPQTGAAQTAARPAAALPLANKSQRTVRCAAKVVARRPQARLINQLVPDAEQHVTCFELDSSFLVKHLLSKRQLETSLKYCLPAAGQFSQTFSYG